MHYKKHGIHVLFTRSTCNFLWLFYIIVSLAHSWCFATSGEQLFRTGNEQYKRGEYGLALTTYESMHKKGSAVWYNMGNAAYKLGQHAHAHLYWARAQKGALPAQQSAINYNMMLLASASQKNTAHALTNRVKRGCTEAIRCLPLFALQFLLLCVWWLMWFLMFTWKRSGTLIIMIILLMANGIVAGMVTMKYFLLTPRRGIVMQSTATLFAGPETRYHILGNATQAAELTILESRPLWHKVDCDSCVGWVLANEIMVV